MAIRSACAGIRHLVQIAPGSQIHLSPTPTATQAQIIVQPRLLQRVGSGRTTRLCFNRSTSTNAFSLANSIWASGKQWILCHAAPDDCN